MEERHQAPPAPAGRGTDRRRDAEARRRDQLEATREEIARIAADYHSRLPRQAAIGIGVIYARFSTRFQDSIADQVRACFEAAVARGLFVPTNHICFDLAVRGAKEARAGLDRARRIIEAGGVAAFLAFSTNRLHRKMHRCLRFVEEELVECGVRAIFPKSDVDTADKDRWKMLLSIHAMMDEHVVSMYAGNVRAAHEGLMGRGLVTGALCFGYAGDPIPGEYTRLKRPRCRVVIDPTAAPIVERIFRWFADDRVTIDEIVRRLNDDPSIPLPPRSQTGAWTRIVVRAMLENPRYRGTWAYGITQSVWQSKKDYARKVHRDRPLRVEQVEALRIIPDDLWARVQRLLQAEPNRGGRKPRDGDRASRPRLLNGLFRCPVHDRRLYVGGPHGYMMYCKSCKEMSASNRPLFSQLNRQLALRLTCRALARRLKEDEALAGMVVAACREAATREDPARPERFEELRRQIVKADRQIAFLLDDAGETEADRLESADKLRRLRRARAADQAELASLESASARPAAVPEEAEVRARIHDFARILEEAATLGGDEAAARELLELLTGGRIDLEQRGERSPQRGWLRGRFRVELVGRLAARAGGAEVAGGEGVEVVVDYRESTAPEGLADRAKALFDEGLLVKEIAARLGVTHAVTAKALRHWHVSRGLPVPDGRSRRSSLGRKHIEPPLFERLADRAGELHDLGLPNRAIAERLGCDRETVAKSLACRTARRGRLSPPDRGPEEPPVPAA